MLTPCAQLHMGPIKIHIYAIRMSKRWYSHSHNTQIQIYAIIPKKGCRCADIHAPSLPSSPDIWLGACSPQLLLLSLPSSPYSSPSLYLPKAETVPFRWRWKCSYIFCGALMDEIPLEMWISFVFHYEALGLFRISHWISNTKLKRWIKDRALQKLRYEDYLS